MQLFTLFSYVMDGFAYAGEALSGRYIGARNREAFTDTVRHLFGWGAVIAVLLHWFMRWEAMPSSDY